MKTRKVLYGGSALLAAALAVPIHVQAGNSIFFQLTPTSNSSGYGFTGSNVTIQNIGDQVTYTVYADVEDDAASPSSCDWELSELSVTSTSDGTGIQGTYAATGATSGSPGVAGVFSYNNSLVVATTSNPGYETDGYNCSLSPPTADSLVNSVGGTIPTLNATGPASQGGGQWLYLSTGVNGIEPASADVVVSGITYAQFNLGQFTWVASNTGDDSEAIVALGGRPLTQGTTSIKEIFKYVSDGTTELIQYGSSLATFGSALVTTEYVPEPTSLGFLAMALTALSLRLRRSRLV